MLRIWQFIVVVAALLCSCSKSEVESAVPLSFAPSADWQPVSGVKSSGTKALIENDGNLKSYSISLLGNAVRGGDTYPVFKNHQLSWSNEEGWHYSPLKYWIPEANYSFAAFCPFISSGHLSNGSVTISADVPSITIDNYNTGWGTLYDARSEDLLFAYASRNTATDGYGAVVLNFEHLLSCVTFNIRNATKYDINSVSGIKLLGVKYICNINVGLDGAVLTPQDAVTDDSKNFFPGTDRSESSPFLPKAMAESAKKALFDCENLTLLPQEVNGGVKLNFVADQNKNGTVTSIPYSLPLNTAGSVTKWEAGKKYVYNIIISSEDIVFQVDIVDWIEHSVEL